jgi:hypothetical protein
MSDDECAVDEAFIEGLVLSLSPQHDCQQLLETLKRLSDEAVKGMYEKNFAWSWTVYFNINCAFFGISSLCQK